MRPRQWWGRDTGLQARMFLTMFLLAAVYLFFMAVLVSAGVDFLGVVFFAALMLGFQYFLSDRLVLWEMGARVVEPHEAPELHATVERLCALADLPKPRVALVNHPMPNAFATGRGPGNSVVAVTTGLLDRLSPQEVEGVIAHELAHIRNRDVLVMTMASFFAMVAQLILRFAMWGGFGYGDHRRDRNGGSLALIYLVSLVVWLVSFLLIRALSRYREYAADRGAAIITGTPSALASALQKISGSMARIPQRDLREVEAMNAFFIVPAISGNALVELLSTHPPVEKRIERLLTMAREMEGL